MFYNDLWGFSIDPPYFGYKSAGQETLFCVFLSFRDLSRLNWPRIFGALIFYHENHLQKKKSMRRGPGAEQVQVAWAP
jgi:hypothetical protein